MELEKNEYSAILSALIENRKERRNKNHKLAARIEKSKNNTEKMERRYNGELRELDQLSKLIEKCAAIHDSMN